MKRQKESQSEQARDAPFGDLHARYRVFRQNWFTLSIYERFEQGIALFLSALIIVIAVMAVWDLSKQVLLLVWSGVLDPLDHRTFQEIFGAIMTVLIALEFRHSLVKVVASGERIIQTQAVLLIAVLALSRKFIILDPGDYTAGTILALGAVVIALGLTYWLVRDREGLESRQHQ